MKATAPLHIESVTSDVVWLNLPNRFVPVDLAPGTGGDLIWTLSGARLEPGTYNATLTVRSNDGLLTPAPPSGAALADPDGRRARPGQAAPRPKTTHAGPVAARRKPAVRGTASPRPLRRASGHGGEHPGIACVQEPDPGLVRYGQNGVLHLGVRTSARPGCAWTKYARALLAGLSRRVPRPLDRAGRDAVSRLFHRRRGPGRAAITRPK